MKVVIIKYNAGNIQSVDFALQRLGVKAEITDNFEKILGADKVIFPGVGDAASTMNYLKLSGLDNIIKKIEMPFLGICLGMQLLCKDSEEGNAECLNIFNDPVIRFKERLTYKIPHMGWNKITSLSGSLFDGIKEDYVYFVHSYYVPVSNHTIAACDYFHPFAAAIQKDNFYAVQFHPEKSGRIGEQILKNFLKL
jgi:glutamine amidotransferase